MSLDISEHDNSQSCPIIITNLLIKEGSFKGMKKKVFIVKSYISIYSHFETSSHFSHA